ncbi:hypothetical protein [Arthrobacter sp. C9C5]|uniref:hypothetical protein n=1 Tax=Arthrobacter sp. C9C5 TaxID=2735267 RepID=UPI001584F3B7|nr:hypothetical protein [Arthrobacter sp. C9C5]NUU32369.1 hypothetical protein [Arthrobacter sp. C9C5]
MFRKITTALAAMALVLLGSLAIVPPANASAGGTYCFHFEDHTPYDKKPVYIDVSYDGKFWYGILPTTSNEKGCGYFVLGYEYRGMYVRALAQWDLLSPDGQILQRNRGLSPVVGLPGQSLVHLGSGLVLCASWVRYAPCR